MPKSVFRRFSDVVCQPVLGVLLRDAWFSRLLIVIATVLVAVSAAGIHVWPCPFLRFTNYPCPGCGLTRSVRALIRGDFQSAIEYNAFGIVAVAVLSLIVVAAVLPDARRRWFADRLAAIERRTAIPAIVVTMMLGYWIFRLASGNQQVLELLRNG